MNGICVKERQKKITLVGPTIKSFKFQLHGSVLKGQDDSEIDKIDSHEIIHSAMKQYHKNSILKQIRDKLYPSPHVLINLQYSIHKCPTSFKGELKFVFPELDINSPNLYIIPIFQNTAIDILGAGVEVESEKRKCLENFYLFGLTLCLSIRDLGFWADLTDPASGFPMLSERGSSYYPDVYGCQRLLGYDMVNCGCCNVLSHPKFGTRVYPSTIFVDCELDVLKELLGDCC